jgi:hypothetical protein
MAVACGAAALITPGTEMVRKADVDALYASLMEAGHVTA